MKLFAPILLLALTAPPCFAELVTTDEDSKDGDHQVEVFRLTVTPAAEPTPAFAYRLIKPLDQLKEGNAPAYYRRIHAENILRGAQSAMEQKVGREWYDWLDADVPISQLPLDKVRQAANLSEKVVTHGPRAGADCKRVDWGFAPETLEGMEAIEFLLPEIQAMRELTRMVALHTRLAIAEHRYADAVDLMRINYRMGHDTAQVPFLVCGLVGIAEIGITNNNALDLIAAPDSPNLYWALAELPEPNLSLREAVQFEMSLGPRVFPLLRDPENASYAPAEWNRRFSGAFAQLERFNGNSRDVSSQLSSTFGGVGAGVLGYSHAKERLVDWGYGRDEVEGMAVGRVLAIYSARVYRVHADAAAKDIYLPWSEVRKGDPAWERLRQSGPFSDDPDRELIPIAHMLTPAVRTCCNAVARTERETALLRAVEAVRMHAAEAGELPAELADVTCVPVPNNPSTGEPFEYTLEAGVATFNLPWSDGHRVNRRYEIRLAD
ncbi:hypothetical protein Pla123a_28510 [Posidoniimonas polymericola]|uniref:Uncharacterized protein n=1 Tax=Posidoniimonas polymericola TaxID=2528002 RepID=A0A5C5YMC0_9BACT|nr:hypothetical protein [Posidoniimonas polymericola]TWT76064.1 hypothetical protein Pla123a_28510 [Posidoniimonas polymericola]